MRNPVAEETVAEIQKLILEHIVLRFPGQLLEPQELMAFAARFGPLDDNRSARPYRHAVFPELFEVISNRATTSAPKRIGSRAVWHTDCAYTQRPTTLTFLNAKELPEIGGDTMFANLYMAYEALSPGYRRMLESLEAIHDVSTGKKRTDRPDISDEIRRLNPPVVHPVVRTHPETGRKALFFDQRARQFVGLTEEESKPIAGFLHEHVARYEFVYRHRWHLNDLLIWDNRCALHFAVPDYDQFRRMQRCALLGPKSGRLYTAHEDTAVTPVAGGG